MPKVQKRFVSPYYLFNEDKKTADVTPVHTEPKRLPTGAYPHICEVNVHNTNKEQLKDTQVAQEMMRVGKRSIGQEEHDKR